MRNRLRRLSARGEKDCCRKSTTFLHGVGFNREALLEELIHDDLKFRLKAGESIRVESYLDRYPRLTKDSAIMLDLLEAVSARLTTAFRGLPW